MAATILGSALPDGVTIGLDKKGVITSTMGFSGTIHGVQLSANGTAQQIWAELEKVNPLAAAAAMASAKKRYASKKLQTRNKFSLGKNPCYVGAHDCVHIACKNDAAIALCNDNDYPIQPSCDYLGTYASDIVVYCPGWSWFGGAHPGSCGQYFDTDNYNVVVRESRC
ncbi:hypothetical protein B0J14DRAFT_648268 [Halenospora varia]|nr:hypothetical protein B0J14DRAFT_648268 [Halenospora varia]